MNGDRTRAAVRQTETTMQSTYRLWFEHARRCDGCKRVSKAQDGCDAGRELWGAYRLARIERAS